MEGPTVTAWEPVAPGFAAGGPGPCLCPEQETQGERALEEPRGRSRGHGDARARHRRRVRSCLSAHFPVVKNKRRGFCKEHPFLLSNSGS